MKFFQKIISHPATAWSILVASLLITAGAWYLSYEFVEARATDRFRFRTEQVKDAIQRRMQDYEQVLRGGVALFDANEVVSREQWRKYVKGLEVEKYYPGIQGIGLSLFVLPEDKAEHEAAIQAEGFPDYRIKPEGERDLYSSIVYLEPFDVRNRRAFGYDMYSQSMRRAAMDKARDTGKPAVSGIVTLVQEMDTDVQKGFLVYLPLYQKKLEQMDVADRRQNILGYVYSPFRANDLMEGVLGSSPDDIVFSIYDGSSDARDNLLYYSDASAIRDADGSSRFERQSSITMSGDRKWNLVLRSNNDFLAVQETGLPLIVAFSGGLIDLLLYFIIGSISRREIQARTIADEMTKEMKTASARLKLAASAAKFGIWEYRMNSGAFICDDRMLQISGLNQAQFNDQYESWEKMIHPDDKAAYRLAMKAAIDGESGFAHTFRIIHLDQSVRYIEANAIVQRDNNKQAICMIGTNLDVSKQRIAEETLATRNRAIEAASYGVVITRADEDGSIVYVNPAFTKITGYTQEEVIGTNCRLACNNNDEATETINKSIQTQTSCNVTILNKRKDGASFWNRLSLSPVQNASGKVTHFVSIQEDITERIEQEEKLKQTIDIAEALAEKAESANVAKSAFLATMSHEIRTPMNAVIGMTDLLLKTDLTEEQREYSRTISNSGETLLDLINDVLDFSKIESGKLEIDMHEFSLLDTLIESLEIIGSKAAEKDLELRYEMAPELPAHFTGDSSRMKQVLLNLLSNAVKFTDEGMVSVKIEGQASADRHWDLIISISDAGIGIPDDAKDKLFEPFTQADSSITRRYQGSGLGLVISKKFANLMDGDIRFVSKEGSGSTFMFSLRLKDAQKNDKVFSLADKSKFIGKNCLIAQMDSISRRLFENILKSWGMEVRGEESLSDANKKLPNPELIILGDMAVETISLQLDTLAQSFPLPPVVVISSNNKVTSMLADKRIKEILPQIVHPEKLRKVLLNAWSGGVPEIENGFKQRDAVDISIAARYPLRILVAEDNPINQRVILRILSKLGYEAQIAGDGAQVIQEQRKNNYDLILMDIQMPVMSGLDAAREILKEASNAPCIAALTANAMTEDEQACKSAGMKYYLSKPIRIEPLIAVIKATWENAQKS